MGLDKFSGERLKFVEHAGEVVGTFVMTLVGFIIWKRDLGDLKDFFEILTFISLADSAGTLEVGKISFVESFLRFNKMFSGG